MRAKIDRRGQCETGRHRPAVPPRLFDVDPSRTHCRDCGGVLMRSAVTKRWFYSGELG